MDEYKSIQKIYIEAKELKGIFRRSTTSTYSGQPKYEKIRNYFINHDKYNTILPDIVHKFPKIKDFNKYIKKEIKVPEERINFVENQFASFINYIENELEQEKAKIENEQQVEQIEKVNDETPKIWVYRFYTEWPKQKHTSIKIELPNKIVKNDLIIVSSLLPSQLYGIFQVTEILNKIKTRVEVNLSNKLIFSQPVTLEELSESSKIKEYIDRTRGFEINTFENDLASEGILNEFVDIVVGKNSEQEAEIISILLNKKVQQNTDSDFPLQTRIESIAGSNISDSATDEDSIGFDVYVEAIGNYLTHEDTKGPLAISIEGEWGSGKSSFMLQLVKWLKKNKNSKNVWFNAWRHDKEESLWAAFALKFVDEMTSHLSSFWERQKAKWKLMRLRFDMQNGWFDLIRTSIVIVLWIFVAIGIWIIGQDTVTFEDKVWQISDTAWKTLGFGSILIAIRGIWNSIREANEIIGNPLRFNLKQHIKDLNYAERIGFIEQFHKDFEKIVDVYADKEKVFVFIDDLDRCEVPRAADMMQALNLMIGEDERLIFIIGMDRQKVAAGLAVKYEKLLPYINYQEDSEFEQDKYRKGTKFGYDFIEKFIQLPFRVPTPSSDKIEAFINSLKKEKTKSTTDEAKVNSPKPISTDEREANDQNVNNNQIIIESERNIDWDKFSLEVQEDSETVQNMVRLVASVLKFNPRRMKQFINLFRLKAYITYNTGQFNLFSTIEDNNSLTFEQLAKFIILELRWPLLIADLENDYDLLKRLSNYAELLIYSSEELKSTEKSKTTTEERWRTDNELIEFIALNSNPKSKDEANVYENFTLTNIDLSKLLQVSAKVTPPQLQNIDESSNTFEESENNIEDFEEPDINNDKKNKESDDNEQSKSFLDLE